MIRGVLVNFRTRTLTRGDRRLKLGAVAFRVVAALLAAPHGLHKRDLIDHVYGDDIDGGPDNPGNILHQICLRYTKPLEHLGLTLHRGRYNDPYTLTEGWTPAARVRHLEAAAAAAHAIAARHNERHAFFAGQVAAELSRISA